MDDQEIYTAITALRFKFGELERKLNFVMAQPKLEYKEVPSGPDMTEVANWLRKGNKIEAVKMYRQMTGVGLKEASVAVDAFGNKHGRRVT